MTVDYIKCGDSALLMQELPDDCIDLTVTSPPYDNLRSYNGFTFDFETIAKQLFRITKEGGVVVWVVGDATINGSETGTSFRQALFFKECGFNLHDTMIWQKDSFNFPEQNRYAQNFEYMFILSKGTPKTFNPIEDKRNKFAGTKIHGTFRNKDGTITARSETWKDSTCREYGKRMNVWQIPAEKANKTDHPAVFPKRIAADHIVSWSNEKDVVFDPFLGSGTTALAARELNRHFIGFEISKEYFEDTKKRIDEAQSQLMLWDFI